MKCNKKTLLRVAIAILILILIVVLVLLYSDKFFHPRTKVLPIVLLNYGMKILQHNVIVKPDYKSVTAERLLKYKDIQPVFFFSHNYDVLPLYAQESKKMITEYCQMHGYEFKEIVHDKTSISPYWIRVKDLVDLSNAYDENAVFIYLDLDTYLNPYQMNNRVDNLLCALDHYKEWDAYVGKDCNIYRQCNSGVMIFKNTPWSKQFLTTWWNKYDDTVWTQENGKWQCITPQGECDWADKYYEQGEMNIMYSNNELDCINHLAVLDMLIISNNLKLSKETYIYHLMGFPNERRLEIFQSLYKKKLALLQQ